MTVAHFTVSQLRVAASCPRILYFDAEHTRRNALKSPLVTRIWKSGAASETTACGALFHAAVEKFNSQAAKDPLMTELLRGGEDTRDIQKKLLEHIYWNMLDRDRLFEKTADQQLAFMTALRVYTGELADILVYARNLARPPADVLGDMFGDQRRRVDATFHVGTERAPVHVTGILDYVFYDWRTEHHRILDYKLTSADQPGNDLFQVCVYALLHHRQHHTQPDAGVLYLHPTRVMVEKKWDDIWAERKKSSISWRRCASGSNTTNRAVRV